MENSKLAVSVLNLVNSAEFRPSKPKTIAKLLSISPEEYPALRQLLKKMVRRGLIAFGANHLISAIHGVEIKPAGKPKTASEVVRGTFRAAVGGFGFVRLLDPELLDSSDDIFIPGKYTKSAMEGDLVEVRLASGRNGRGREGAVTEVIERARRNFVGTFERVNGEPVVWLDGVKSDYPIGVGDVRGMPLENENKVIVELVKFPETAASGHFTPGEGVILEVLGASRNPAVDTIAVIHQFNLPEAFPDDVLDDARAVADQFNEHEFGNRRDLTKVTTLTIDPVDARDFDDAISLSKNEVGNWELMVHIADVSHFVQPGTRLDEEAADRATSVYLPDRVIPMLPEIISNSLASLQPDKLRFAKTVMIEFDDQGLPIHTDFFASVICNKKRLTYEMVDQFLEAPQKLELTDNVAHLLTDMYSLAMLLRQRRIDRGAIELNLPEVKIELDKSGKVKGAHLTQYTDSHKIIEEFMLAANQAVATYLTRKNVPFLRRAHPPPQGIKLKRLTEFIRAIGIQCSDMHNRFEIQRVVTSVRNTPLEQAANYAILKSMSKAVYQPQEERHFALDMTNYCHFTSPIRRYPDLIVHRILQDLIDGKDARVPVQLLNRQGQHCSDREQNAESAERQLIRVKLLHYMHKRIGDSFTGTITTVKQDRIIVQLHQVPVEGVLMQKSLPADRYRFDRQSHSMEGYRKENRFRLGDAVAITVTQVNLAKRELYFTYQGRSSVQKLGTGKKQKKNASSVDGERVQEAPMNSRKKTKSTTKPSSVVPMRAKPSSKKRGRPKK